MKRVVAQFAVLCLMACAIVAVGGYYLAARLADHVEEKSAEEYVERIADGLIEPSLLQGLEPAERLQIDAEIRERMELGALLRVKLWRGDGTVVYSDESRLIGQNYPLDAEKQELLQTGGTHVERTTFTDAENQFDQGLVDAGEPALEVYTVVGAGTDVRLLEVYLPMTGTTEERAYLTSFIVPVVLLGPLVLVLMVLPLGLSLLRRLHSADGRRVRVMEGAMEATEVERTRIARLLHDVVIPDLAAVKYLLSALSRADRLDDKRRTAVAESGRQLTHSLSSLRTLLDDLHEPAANPEGFRRSVAELTAPLASDGVRMSVHVQDPAEFGPSGRRLAHAVIRESLRNVARHASATRVEVTARVDDRGEHAVLVRVADNGCGFTATEGSRAGHHGLRLLADAVRREGGSIEVDSIPGGGTVVAARLPLPTLAGLPTSTLSPLDRPVPAPARPSDSHHSAGSGR